ncbi:MAG: hypothetical protein ACLR5Q_02930 [Coprococcus sp.]
MPVILPIEECEQPTAGIDARLWGYNRRSAARYYPCLNITARTAMRWQNIWMLRKIISEEVLVCYRSKYVYTVVDNYAIYFIPNIAVKRF